MWRDLTPSRSPVGAPSEGCWSGRWYWLFGDYGVIWKHVRKRLVRTLIIIGETWLISIAELSLLSVLVVVYLGARSTRIPEHGTPMQDDAASPIGHDAHLSDHRHPDQSSGPGTRNRKPHEHGGTGRSGPAPVHSVPKYEGGRVSASDVEDSSIGTRGLVWATSERNYR